MSCAICKKELINNPEPRPIGYVAAFGGYRAKICPDESLAYHQQASSLQKYMQNCPSDVLRHFMRSELETIMKTREATI